MKICVLGSYKGVLDEGMANVSFHIYNNLKKIYPQTIFVNIQDVTKSNFWKTITNFKPDILHLVPGPTTKGLTLSKIIQKKTDCFLVVSSTRMALPNYFKIFSKLLKPNLVIVNSRKSQEFYEKNAYKTKFLPNGVDVEKFKQITAEEKIKLRQKYGIEKNQYVILHIGPIIKGRNQRSLLDVPDVKILLVASTTNPSDNTEISKLNKANVTVWKKFFPNVEEIYQLSDLYVFPIFEDLNSIEIPLSVLEAMSCNLPVVTTRYGGLESILEEGDGLFFVNNPKELKKTIVSVKDKNLSVKTRDKVLNYSWENIVNQLAQFYQELVEVKA